MHAKWGTPLQAITREVPFIILMIIAISYSIKNSVNRHCRKKIAWFMQLWLTVFLINQALYLLPARIQKILNSSRQQYKLSEWTGGCKFIIIVLSYIQYKVEQGAHAGCAPSKSVPVLALYFLARLNLSRFYGSLNHWPLTQLTNLGV